MSVVTSISTPDRDSSYPALFHNRLDRTVVLFYAEGCGMVVASCGCPSAGCYSERWNMSDFERMIPGSFVTITQG